MSLVIFIGVLIFAIANIIGLLGISFILWMAVDAAKTDKYWWIVLIVGVPLIGAIIYFFVEKKHEYAKISNA